MSLFKKITKAVGSVAHDAVKATGTIAGGTVAVVTSTVSGGSTKDAIKQVGDGLNQAVALNFKVASLGQGDKLDAVSGGLFSASQGASKLAGDTLQGKSVSTDLKDTVRTGAVAGASFFGGAAGGAVVNSALSKNGETNLSLKSAAKAVAGYGTGSSFLDNVFNTIGATPRNPTASSNGRVTQTGSTQTGNFSIPEGTNLFIPLAIGLSIIGFVLIKKKK